MTDDSTVTRQAEITLGFLLLHTCPTRPGRASPLFKNSEDLFLYYFAVIDLLGMTNTKNFHLVTDLREEETEGKNPHGRKVFEEARQDILRAQEGGIMVWQKHVVSLLAAKLELETGLGALPSRRTVKRRAKVLYTYKFGTKPSYDDKEWRKFFTHAGLDYLPR
jgi:hypothetical protein